MDELNDLVPVMRLKGVLVFEGPSKKGLPMKIVLGPEPAKPTKKVDTDPKQSRREMYELQLGRSVSDAELEHLP